MSIVDSYVPELSRKVLQHGGLFAVNYFTMAALERSKGESGGISSIFGSKSVLNPVVKRCA